MRIALPTGNGHNVELWSTVGTGATNGSDGLFALAASIDLFNRWY
jgi:hypothetical protein